MKIGVFLFANQEKYDTIVLQEEFNDVLPINRWPKLSGEFHTRN